MCGSGLGKLGGPQVANTRRGAAHAPLACSGNVRLQAFCRPHHCQPCVMHKSWGTMAGQACEHGLQRAGQTSVPMPEIRLPCCSLQEEINAIRPPRWTGEPCLCVCCAVRMSVVTRACHCPLVQFQRCVAAAASPPAAAAPVGGAGHGTLLLIYILADDSALHFYVPSPPLLQTAASLWMM